MKTQGKNCFKVKKKNSIKSKIIPKSNVNNKEDRTQQLPYNHDISATTRPFPRARLVQKPVKVLVYVGCVSAGCCNPSASAFAQYPPPAHVSSLEPETRKNVGVCGVHV